MATLERARIRVTVSYDGQSHSLSQVYPKNHTTPAQLAERISGMSERLERIVTLPKKRP